MNDHEQCRNPFVNQVVSFVRVNKNISKETKSQSLRESGRFVHEVTEVIAIE